MFAKLFPTLFTILLFLGVHSVSVAGIPHAVARKNTARDIPSLTEWSQTVIGNLFEATNQSDFESAIVNYLAATTERIIIDGEELTRQQYIDRLHNSRSTFTSAKIQWIGSVELQGDDGDETSGVVGLFFTVDIIDPSTGSSTPTETATCAFNLKIAQDPTLTDDDSRRVIQLNTVYTRVQN
ncbi:hypothetical protein BDY19DRAFT_901463 [Irpex rosettiformis]|uniref:Uncharacterized protein n=1 Tax=Irpex rosettiformis TaxID=378272 RepID=A0ACB8UIE6_9APHY|nr:hypothetical protein BDY19DRAFT_901463 [Irpex rosettiformis]